MAEKIRLRDRWRAACRAFWQAAGEEYRRTEPRPDPLSDLFTSTKITRVVTINGKVVEGPEADEIGDLMSKHTDEMFADTTRMFAEIDKIFKKRGSSDGNKG